jgi:phosphoribosylamine--glycine ligase
VGENINEVTNGELLEFTRKNGIDFTVVGPEAPLADGIVDLFRSDGRMIFGPERKAAQLESSKVFAKRFMRDHGVSTCGFEVHDSEIGARRTFLKYLGEDGTAVIKCDGLAAGKGVMVSSDPAEGQEFIANAISGKSFGDAGKTLLIERALSGFEVSLFAFVDGRNYRLLPPSQDYKRALEGDKGPNTGGMGAVCPVRRFSMEQLRECEKKIIAPTVKGISNTNLDYRGVLYFGIMFTTEGPQLLEYNVRFGDPEAQVVLPLMSNELLGVMEMTCLGRLDEVELEYGGRSAVVVVVASGGYPGSYDKGVELPDLSALESEERVIFHAGTKLENGKLISSGGRVLGITQIGDSVDEVRAQLTDALSAMEWPGFMFRRDIGFNAG